VTGATLDAPLPVFIVDIHDIRKFVRNETQPIDILTKEINWIRMSEEAFGPARFLFPIRLNEDPASTEDASMSSVIIEKMPGTSWRAHRFGRPKLIRAVKTYSSHAHDFVIWIPSINRYFLGRMGADFRFKMTVLFDDPIADARAGHEFDPGESRVMDKLKALAKKLLNVDTDKRLTGVTLNP
jgi:hypothetical protein